MRTWIWTTLLAVLLFAQPLTGSRLPAAERPNVLFILCDDLRPDALGCYGSPHVRTPNVDRLAAEGVRFQNAFCTTSLCSPSRASILSGLYAHRHGVVNNFTEYPADLPSFPRQLQGAGYATAYIGKWHMGEENDEKRPGFDYFVTHKGQGKYFDTEFNLDGRERKVLPGYYTHVVTELALDWLKNRPADKPWLLCLGHKAPHSYYTPEPKYAHAFDNVEVRYPASAFELDDKPKWITERLGTWHGLYGPLFEFRKKYPDPRPEAVKDFENMTHAYWATMLSVDDSVGRLVEALKARGELERTLIVFMGDNGLLAGEHGMVDKRTMHDPSIRIPIVARYPELVVGPKVIDQQVLTIDMAPSILELCAAPPLPKIDGRSWVKLVRSGDPDWRTSWFYEYNYEQQFPYTPNVRGVRTDSWKYIHYPHGDGSADRHLAELYDLKSDPDERKNLIDDPAQAPRLAKLKAELERLMRATDLTPETDQMPLDEGIKQVLPDLNTR